MQVLASFSNSSMALTKIDHDYTLSQAHPETMDFLSQAWCDFAVQAVQPDQTGERSLVVQENAINEFGNDARHPSVRMDKSARVDDGDDFIPPWKSNDVKAWIWMQQAMHPEVNYNSYFRKKWKPWKLAPFKIVSIKKWLNEIKQRRKEDQRLQKAEVHAAISVAGVAAALASLAAESSDRNTTKELAVASAAALVAAQCAKVAEAMGAKREQLSSAISSAISSTSSGEIVTLTAAATISLRGVDTLKARTGYKNMLNGNSHVLPLEDNNETDNFDFEECRAILAKGADLNVETPDGRYSQRSVAVILNNRGKVVLKMKKLNILNAFGRQKERIVFALHAELYKVSQNGITETGYLIVLTTDRGIIKLDMMNDDKLYRTWSITIDHMLMLSTIFTKYDLQSYKR